VCVFSGICYSKTRNAYTTTYAGLGEFMAFLVGWNLLLEYVIGAACLAKGISMYVDFLLNNAIQNKFMEIFPISWSILNTYFDLFAFALPILVGSKLICIKKSFKILKEIFSIQLCWYLD
jgi:amino acid transporter